MKDSWYTVFFRSFNISKERKLAKKIIHTLSASEKIVLGVLVIIFAVSAIFLLRGVQNEFLVEVPDYGGSISEGVIGAPRFVNPILATLNADTDLTALTYSGLLRALPEGGLIPDIAEDYTISEDGLIYTFRIRNDAYFHDGIPVRAEDIEFTVLYAQDQTIKSPKRANWDGVQIVVVNEKEIQFILNQPYAPFLENTTLGILPKHIWKNVDLDQFAFSQFNIEPVGSGPYKVASIKRNSSGVPEKYILKSFDKYTLGEPFISKIEIRFYNNEEDLLNSYKRGFVQNINSISPENLDTLGKINIEQTPLPRIFGVFFNQNQATIFAKREVRRALDLSLNKDRIVESILAGYGTVINSPLPPNVAKNNDSEYSIEKATLILEENGWEKDEEGIWAKKDTRLTFSLSTSNTPELKAVANIIEEEWENFGVLVDLQIFEPGALNQNVIRPRRYDALLFGEIVGRELDLYAFWHSSQMNDPGLNIALYANITADKLLEDARKISDREERLEKYSLFEDEIHTDSPSVFLYSPDFIYIFNKNIKGMNIGSFTVPAERFLNIHNWYIETNKIWKLFN